MTLVRVLIAGLLLLAGCTAVDDVPPEITQPLQIPCEGGCGCDTYLLHGVRPPEPILEQRADGVEESRFRPTVQTLVVTAEIAAGTEVRAIIESPTRWLSAKLLDAEDRCDTMIPSIADLTAFDGLAIAHDIAPGLILDTRQIVTSG